MHRILGEGVSNASSSYVLPVSLADWSTAVWGVVFVCQLFWLTFALTGICRQTALGPVYNNPKILPVQVHFFFSLAILTQVSVLITSSACKMIISSSVPTGTMNDISL